MDSFLAMTVASRGIGASEVPVPADGRLAFNGDEVALVDLACERFVVVEHSGRAGTEYMSLLRTDDAHSSGGVADGAGRKGP